MQGAGFAGIAVRSELRSFSFASFDDYFAGIEAGAGFSGQEFVKLSEDLQRIVRDDVRRSFPGADSRPFVVEMEVLVGSGRK